MLLVQDVRPGGRNQQTAGALPQRIKVSGHRVPLYYLRGKGEFLRAQVKMLCFISSYLSNSVSFDSWNFCTDELLPIWEVLFSLQRYCNRFYELGRPEKMKWILKFGLVSQVWQIRVDVNVMNHDGNIIDCSSIAAIAALAHFRWTYIMTIMFSSIVDSHSVTHF